MTLSEIVFASGGQPFEDGPDRGRIIVDGDSTGGGYALMEWLIAANETVIEDSDYGPHSHGACEETFLIRSGHLDFLLGDVVTTLGPGDFVRVPKGVRHGYCNTSGRPVDLLVSFYPAGLETLFIKYRTDRTAPLPSEGFVAEATRRFASTFE